MAVGPFMLTSLARHVVRIRDACRERPPGLHRVALPVVLPTIALGISFGVLARPLMGPVAPTVMSVVVFSGGAQFAALSVLQGGGAAIAAITAGMLMNARWIPMSFAVAPALRGGRLRRAGEAQAIVDASFVMSSRTDGTFDRGLLIGATLPQAASWISGRRSACCSPTASAIRRRSAWMRLPRLRSSRCCAREVRGRRAYQVMAVSATITIVLTSVAPAGAPVVAASSAALLGLRSAARA